MKKNLLFMGDSITAGVYSDGKLIYSRDSYDNMIVSEYCKRDMLGTHYNIAVSGFTTSDMLNMLVSDITYNQNVAYNITPEKTYRNGNYKMENSAILLSEDKKISELIKDADEIIMTLGSNDFVKYFDTHLDRTFDKLDLKDVVSKDFKSVISDAILEGVVKNFCDILTYIYNINEDVCITLIGSYTPSNSTIINKVFYKQLGRIENELLRRVKRRFKHVRVLSIKEEIAKNVDLYLPNPLNIHLSYEGYRTVADTYIHKYMDNDKIEG